MSELFILLVPVGIAINAVWQIAVDPRIERNFIVRSLAALAAYIGFCALGVLALLPVIDRQVADRQALALAGSAFILLWVAAAVFWLIRLAPRLKPLPSWVGKRFGWLDAGLLGGSAAAYLATCLIG